MKLYLAGLLLPLLAGCLPHPPNTFQVDTAESPDAIAVLVLCGKETPLSRRGHVLEVSLPSMCEGEGDIRLRLKDGGRPTCHIGYVTTGIAQAFRFRLRGGQCESMP
jgi:hypothetical protein